MAGPIESDAAASGGRDAEAPREFVALYRRYRPQRFADILGQEHVVRALKTAVAEDRVGHAYLFSGPRGTGKTSTARILAKALNCENVQDGEPCGVCASCVAITEGRSFDVIELDAASNRGIDAMKDLIASTALASPGRHKVYILDEVHQLSTDAASALLKTLEEPPPHVKFVLATTDPQKVFPTIRSRTQHLNFHLLPAETLTELVTSVAAREGEDLPPDAIERVVREGAGSGRDALSMLDQVLAAGGVPDDELRFDELVRALAEDDAAGALRFVATAVANGRDPRALTERLVAHLRDVFLAAVAPDVLDVPDSTRATLVAQAEKLGAPGTVRALEALGATLTELRHAPDPRVLLDVTLVRLANPRVDTSLPALLERVERLERAVAGGTVASSPTPPTREPAAPASAPSAPPAAAAPARAALGALRASAAKSTSAPSRPAQASASEPLAGPPAADPVASAPAARAELPSRDELTLAWADHILPKLKPPTRSLFGMGRFVEVQADYALMAVPRGAQTSYAQRRGEVEAALEEHFGRRVPLKFKFDETLPRERPAPRGPAEYEDEPPEAVDLEELVDAPVSEEDEVARVRAAFPGAELIEEGGA